MSVVVLDYGMGNVTSVCNALQHLGISHSLTNDPNQIIKASGMIIPGVGAFEQGMERLQSKNLTSLIRDFVGLGRPVLGICLGMQMMFDESEENGSHQGLGLIPGKVVKLTGFSRTETRLPHIGWAEAHWQNEEFEVAAGRYYFVHSYVVEPLKASDVAARTDYGGVSFVSSVKRGNLMGVQFHPERSGPLGLKFLRTTFSV